MPAGTATETFRTAVEHHQAGRLAQAEALYRQFLQDHPQDGDALHLMGVLAYQGGRLQLALDLVRRAIQRQPSAAPFFRNLGLILTAQVKLSEAISAFETSLKLKPDFAEAYANLGYVYLQLGQTKDALAAISRSAELQPNALEISGLQARLLLQENKIEEAVAVLRRMLTLRPDHAPIWNDLGIALKLNRQPAEAISAWRQALARKPDFSAALRNLAIALLAENQFDESIRIARELITRAPQEAALHLTLGTALLRKGDPESAVPSLRSAAELQPESADAVARLAEALVEAGAGEDAISTLKRAVELNPKSPSLLFSLGKIHLSMGDYDAGIAAFEAATTLDDRAAATWSGLGRALFEVGEIEAASDSLQRANDLEPDNLDFKDQWIYALHHHPDADSSTLFDEARKWETARAARNFGAAPRPPTPDHHTSRFFRIGFLIPRFNGNDVFLKLFPLFRRHNHEQFHFYAYSDAGPGQPDIERLKPLAREWRNTGTLSDQQLAGQIRQDGIDIFIELSQHAPANRLLTLCANSAPVQLTYGLYPGTTGLGAIRYRLSDEYLDPIPAVQIASEKTIHLPNSYWCLDPESLGELENQPSPPLRAAANGFVTFGGLQPAEKLNDEVLESWAEILRATPASRMLLPSLPDRAKKRVVAVFQAHDVSADRFEFATKPEKNLFEIMPRIDVALDSFPFCETTSSLMALWMGIPVVSLVGQTPVGRMGLSMLANLDLRSLTAESRDRYVEIAAQLAGDLSHVGQLRSVLRQRMLESPLTDAKRFTRNFEAILRDVWVRSQSD